MNKNEYLKTYSITEDEIFKPKINNNVNELLMSLEKSILTLKLNDLKKISKKF